RGPRFVRPVPSVAVPAGHDADAPLTQAATWDLLAAALPEHTALLADTGTAYWGAAGMPLPADTVFVGQPVWSSIGYALPAVLGQGLADRTRRPVLVIGDGAAPSSRRSPVTVAARCRCARPGNCPPPWPTRSPTPATSCSCRPTWMPTTPRR
ncbi:MAG: putative indolepyruvate decarboxylase, partial [Klenkia sp.]|nr:putative indolepyruvate decarboxylase [Klenkia sp.]